MMSSGWTVVLDVGKTRSKATLWDENAGCVAVRSRANRRLESGTMLLLDFAGIERWLEGVLAEFATAGPITAIIPVAHGAGVALIRRGRLQCAPLDYEWNGVAADRAAYDKQRDSFALTGSPALPAGLNIGVQLHWLESLQSADFRSGVIVPWAQYWAWLLSGVLASEVTSLGCHTDLWKPYESALSDLAIRRGWAGRLAPLRPAGAVLGTLEPEWVQRTGLSPKVEVYCGLHDSNAALLDARSHEAVEGHDATVLSTGTWFIAMRSPLPARRTRADALCETRDCLLNVDAAGSPVPSSRFMGGREIEILTGTTALSAADVVPAEAQASIVRAIEAGDMILPSGVPGVGPFPNSKRTSITTANSGDIAALAHLYAALLADVSLDLIGSCDTVLVEGRFSQAPIFVRALAALRSTTRILVSGDEHGVARGALRLANIRGASPVSLERASPLPVDIGEYRHRWREAAERAG
jgi:sugar (pentulose or hexulose) kinase